MKKLTSLMLFDLKYIWKDFLLIVAVFAPLLMAIIFRFGIPLIIDLLEGRINIELEKYTELLSIVLLMTVPVMIGMFAAFIILDEKDEHIIPFLAVTPLSKKGYLFYRLSAPVFISTVLSFVALFIAGYRNFIQPSTLPVIVLVGIEAPLVALFIAGFAKNKVEGLAVAKVASILLLVPLSFYLISDGWKYIGGILPPFWIAASYHFALHSSILLFVLHFFIALVMHIGGVVLLYRKFVLSH
ncbi:hypothetical protein [Bacillus sp. 03113]|uniref:hypothetical protein n=1 Tax=Bacillus sp. 03113 TaxID=2578211 RepID=UPI001144867A|nr:hypothetical protein [Bacillus sp. 03113]